MNKIKKNDGIEPRDYNRIVGKAGLAALRMTKSQFEVKPGYILIENNYEEYKIISDLEDSQDEFLYDRDKGIAFGEIMWRFRVRRKNSVLLKLQSTYIVIYNGIEDEDEMHVRTFFEHMAPSQCYPYFRQRVAQSAADAMIELPLLPMLKLRAPVKSKAS